MNTVNVKSKDLRTTNGVIRASLNGQPVEVENAEHLHGLASGLKHGEVIVRGSTGDYLGALNAGAVIKVSGDTGKYTADNMTGGSIIVEGSAGYGTAQYCYGGFILVHGDAGDFTATMNKGAAILIVGNVGDEAATYMLKGSLIVVGNAGKNFANYLIRGNVYIGGQWESLGHNTLVEAMTDEDIASLQAIFETHGIHADPAFFKKIVAASEKPFYK